MKNAMKLLVVTGMFMVASPLLAVAAGKTYQVTGPVAEITADKIVVEKGKEKWEIARGAAEIPATVQVGSKVTVEYVMTADKVIEKDAAKPPKAKK